MSFEIDDSTGLPAIDMTAGAVRRYGIDLADVLTPGNSVASLTVTASGDVTASAQQTSGTVVSAKVTAGTGLRAGFVKFTWTETGADGETDSRSIQLNIKGLR